jgi:hypothetical protein
MATSHSVSLSWTASTDPVNGYNVYRSTTSGAKTTLVNTSTITGTTFTDTTALAGTWFYDVTAIENGVESAVSNSVQAVLLPAPPTNLVLVSDN